jgi:hypothetical protein
MSAPNTSDYENLDDLYNMDMDRINIDDLIYTQCRSTVFISIHLLSRYMINYQIVEIPTIDKLLIDLSKVPVEGEVTEESFLRGMRNPDIPLELHDPAEKLALLQSNLFIKKVRKYDPEFKLFWHYHLLHLICRYLFLYVGSSVNIKKLLGKLYNMRKKCWYYICTYTNTASSSSHAAGYADSNFKSNNSRYTQAHLWYIEKKVQDYSLFLRRKPLEDIDSPIDVDSAYWDEIRNAFIQVHELISTTPKRGPHLKSDTKEDIPTPTHMSNEACTPDVSNSLPEVPPSLPEVPPSSTSISLEQVVTSTLVNTYRQIAATVLKLFGKPKH